MKKEKKPVEATNGRQDGPIVTDPYGSYTGRSENRYEVPVQDVDDL